MHHAPRRATIVTIVVALVAALAVSTVGGAPASAESGESVPAARDDGARLSVGALHSCVALRDGAVRCWGNGTFGQLGLGNTSTIGDTETPGTVAPIDLGPTRNATAIAAGNFHTCAIVGSGAVRCWGFSGNGQLGYPNVTAIGDDETPGSVGTVDLGAGRAATALAAGGLHTCAILDDGSVRCWGSGFDGELGYGNPDDIGDDETPGSAGAVDLGAGRTATALAAGGSHTCAILDDGTVRCWGLGTNGRLGYANTDTIGDDETPGSIGTVNLGAGRTATAISAGETHTCAILDDGTVRCWGLGTNGRLGYANTDPVGDDETPGSAGPVDIGVGRTATAISAGGQHTCAILDDGTVRCWGLGGAGQLGYDDAASVGDDETPGTVGPIDLGLGLTAIAISAGAAHTCALLNDETVRCWGDGSQGRLGFGATSNVGDGVIASVASTGPVFLPPVNDDFADATSITGASAVVSGTSAVSDTEPNEPTCASSSYSIWYRWTAPATGSVTIDTVDSRFDTVLSVHAGSALDALTQLACNDDLAPASVFQSRVTLPVQAGATYAIRVAGFGLPEDDSFGRTTLTVALTPDSPLFTTAPPARFADTRPGETTVDGQFAGAGIRAGGSTYEVQIAGRGAVPGDATAAVMNLTTVGATGLGYATAYPCTGSVPTASSVNYGAGGVDPNELIVKLSPTGTVCVFVLTDTHLLIDVVGWATASSPYVALAPARLADTRPGETTVDGQFAGAGSRAGGSSYEIQVTGRGGVPAGAAAAVVNLTVTGATGLGYATAYPCGTVPTASSVNYAAGQTVPNELIVKLSPTGTVCVFVLTAAHLLVDVVGHVPAGNAYTPIDPARLADTRPGEATVDGQFAGAGIVRGGTTYQVQVTGRAGVPVEATGAVINLTVTGGTGPGYATAYPCTGTVPTASSVNYAAGTTRPNEIVAQLSAGGAVCIFVLTDAHLIVDLVGHL